MSTPTRSTARRRMLACAAVAALVALLAAGNAAATDSTAYRDAVLADGPQIYWRFGEPPGSTTATDSSGSGINGTYYSATLGVAGALIDDADTAARFTAFGSAYAMAAGPDSGSFAVEVWVKLNGTSGSGLVSGGAQETTGWSASVGSDGIVRAEEHVWNTYRRTISGPQLSIADGEWHHVVVNFNGDSGRIYVDGIGGNVPPSTVSAVVCDRWSPCAYPEAIPALIAGRGEADLDELAVYYGLLGEERVLEHYWAGREEPVEPSPDDPAESFGPAIEAPDPEPSDSDDPDAPNEDAAGFGAANQSLSATVVRRAVTKTENSHMFKFTNADGTWTIYKLCFDSGVGSSPRRNVGPGYIAHLKKGATVFVDDYRNRADTWSPGFLNSVNGGIGAFGWHHARGKVGETPAGDDPTTTSVVEKATGRNPYAIESRMCSTHHNKNGVYARSWTPPKYRNDRADSPLDLNFDVWFRDSFGNTGWGPSDHAIARLRYRYTFLRSSVRVWISVTTYAKPNADGTPFVKEPKFAVVTRGGGFSRLSVLGGADGNDFQIGITRGERECTGEPVCSLDTGHSAAADRKRVRWDFGTQLASTDANGVENNGGPSGCTKARPCLNVVMRSYPTSANGDIVRSGRAFAWEGGGYGLDNWSVKTAGRAISYPRDTLGGGGIALCGVDGGPIDVNGDDVIDEKEAVAASRKSEAASPDMDSRRRWEHGGWRSNNEYQAGMTLFHGWEDERGGEDCEPLQRAFGPQGESFGTFAVYSLNDGWSVTP